MFGRNTAYKIKTPNGWEPFMGVKRVKKQPLITVNLHSGNSITCTKDHLLSVAGQFFIAKDIADGSLLDSTNGYEEVTSITDAEADYSYDVVNAGKDHCYYTNGTLSHNCDFLGSSNTLISTNTIRRMPVVDPIHSNNGLDIYEEPKAYVVAKDGTKKRSVYAMSVDCSEGVGLDFSTIVVIDVTAYPFRLVAKYRANTISPLVLPQIIYDVGKYYNWADCLIETNGIGSQVVAILNFDLEYPNIVAFSFGRGELGLKTTKATKSVGVSNLKIMLERDKLLITDYDVIQELSVFVPKGTSYAAEPGYNDDLVMALVNFSWFTTTDYFKNLTDTDLRLKIMEERNKAMEETEIMPFGILVDGINDDDGELQWTDSDLGLNW